MLRTLPSNVEAEEAILGAILWDPDAFGQINEIVSPEDFYSDTHRRFYELALERYRLGSAVDIRAMNEALSNSDEPNLDDLRLKLPQMLYNAPSTGTALRYSQMVVEKGVKRLLVTAGEGIEQAAYDESIPLKDVIKKSNEILFGLTAKRFKNGLTSVSEALIQTFNEIESYQSNLVMPGVPSGFYDLDAMTQGFQPSDLILVGARPSMGKTSFCLSVAEYAARTLNLPVAIFSLEMPKHQLVYRLLSAELRIPLADLRTGRIRGDDWPRLGKAIDVLSSTPIFIDDTPYITVGEMRNKARRLAAEHGGKLGLVLIDYLQLLEGGQSSSNKFKEDNENQALGKITRSLKGLARELNVPVLVLSQLNRNVESRTNKTPCMSDFRGSGAIEQDADLIMGLLRPEYYFPDSEERGTAQLNLLKHRNGPTGTVKLLFQAECSRFSNLPQSA